MFRDTEIKVELNLHCFPVTPLACFVSSSLKWSNSLRHGGEVGRREHPVVDPLGETYITLLLSLFRLPV